LRIYRTVKHDGQTPKSDTGIHPCGSLRRCLCGRNDTHTIAGCCANDFTANHRTDYGTARHSCEHGHTSVANDRAVDTAHRLD
jgi:hypothetical protein